MARLEDVERGAIVNGILPNQAVTVVDVNWLGSTAIELTYKDGDGNLGNELIYRDSEPTLEIVTAGRPWSFDGTGRPFDWSPKRIAFDWRICLTRDWRCIHRVWMRCPTRSRRFMRRCSPVNRCVICLLTTPARVKRL